MVVGFALLCTKLKNTAQLPLCEIVLLDTLKSQIHYRFSNLNTSINAPSE
jgi:hypothetical protein